MQGTYRSRSIQTNGSRGSRNEGEKRGWLSNDNFAARWAILSMHVTVGSDFSMLVIARTYGDQPLCSNDRRGWSRRCPRRSRWQEIGGTPWRASSAPPSPMPARRRSTPTGPGRRAFAKPLHTLRVDVQHTQEGALLVEAYCVSKVSFAWLAQSCPVGPLPSVPANLVLAGYIKNIIHCQSCTSLDFFQQRMANIASVPVKTREFGSGIHQGDEGPVFIFFLCFVRTRSLLQIAHLGMMQAARKDNSAPLDSCYLEFISLRTIAWNAAKTEFWLWRRHFGVP